jgi:hypothetical protein
MSCIVSTLTRHTAEADIIRHPLILSLTAAESPVIGIDVERASIGVARHTAEISIMPSCRTSTGNILIVSPEVVWLTEDNGYEGVFEVVSNVEWQIYNE